jgi:hypothetical protein
MIMDTDALLAPVDAILFSRGGFEHQPIAALRALVEAHTAAWKEIREDLSKCTNDEKVRAIIVKVEKAMTDLAIDSQKLPQWLRDAKDVAPGTPPYGQYPVNQPLNPYNPVPLPPGYDPNAQPSVQEGATKR